MHRGATARSAFPLLAAVLVALQFLVFTASFAYAHTARHAVAKAQPAATVGEVAPAEIVTCRDAGRAADPAGPLRARDRSRPVDDPGISEQPPSAHHTSVAPAPAAPASPRPRTPRPTGAQAPALLQVFRC